MLTLKLTLAKVIFNCHIFEKVNFIVSLDCNNEKKLKLTLTALFLKKLTLAKVIFNCDIFEKVNFILSLDCNNEKKLKLTLKLTFAKVTFN